LEKGGNGASKPRKPRVKTPPRVQTKKKVPVVGKKGVRTPPSMTERIVHAPPPTNVHAHVRGMSSADVVVWLRSQGLHSRIIEMFSSLEITGEELPDVDYAVLTDMNVPKLYAKRLLVKISMLLSGGQQTPNVTPIRSLPKTATLKIKQENPPAKASVVRSPPEAPPSVPKIKPQPKKKATKKKAKKVLAPKKAAPPKKVEVKKEVSEDESIEEESEDIEEEEEAEEYEPEKIVDRVKEGRKWILRVRWKNFGPDDDTWEPEAKWKTFDVYKKYMAVHKKKIGTKTKKKKSRVVVKKEKKSAETQKKESVEMDVVKENETEKEETEDGTTKTEEIEVPEMKPVEATVAKDVASSLQAKKEVEES